MCFDFVTIIKPRKRSLTWRSPWNSRQSMKKLWKNTMLEMKKYVLFLLMSPISIYLGFLCMGALIMIYEFVAGASDLGWRGLEETWS